jgi:hypothetical protein
MENMPVMPAAPTMQSAEQRRDRLPDRPSAPAGGTAVKLKKQPACSQDFKLTVLSLPAFFLHNLHIFLYDEISMK